MKLRVKFIIFIFNLLLVLIFGMVLYLDGLYFIFIITELTLILFFIVVYTQLYDNLVYKFNKLKYVLFSFFFFCILIVRI